jgi:predicted enzyme related to lactoylglutathione lyase
MDAAGKVNLRGMMPILPVRDVAASLDYYTRVLGFRTNWHGGDFAATSRDAITFFLSGDEQGHPGTWVWVYTNDVDAEYKRCVAAGAKIHLSPQNFDWGYEFQVEDLDGNVLRFAGEHKPSAPLGEWLRDDGSRWRQLAQDKWERVK